MKLRLLSLALFCTLGCSPERPPKPAQTAEPRAARDAPPEVTRAPSELPETALPASPLAGTLRCTLASGETTTLADLLGDGRALVIAYTSLRCPVTRLYAPSWPAWEAEWSQRGVRLLLVDPMAVDADADVLATARELGWSAPVARDPEGELSAALDARRTADVFLLDAELRVRYRGARDDQYGIGYRRAEPRERYLHDALSALLAGQPVERPATEAPGCKLNR